MPLLTITNLQTSPFIVQDPTGISEFSVKVGDSDTESFHVTSATLEALETLLDTAQTGGHIRWSAKDDSATQSDSVPQPPTILDLANYFAVTEDFALAASGTLPKPWAKDLNGTTTGDFLANTAAGVYSLATAAVSEAQDAQLTWGDQLMIDPSKNPIFEARVRVNIPGATITADERWVVGLCSAHANSEDSLDAVVSNIWFRGEGANLNIYIEGDDGTTDTNDTDSAVDYADNTWMLFKIDMSDLSAVVFSIDGVPVATTISVPLLSGSTLLQPIFCYQRDAGSEINLLQVDWCRVSCDR